MKRKVLAAVAVVVLLLVASASVQRWRERGEATRYPAPGELVDIGGRRLHLLCVGSGSPTIVLEASGLGTVLLYENVQRELAATNRVCAYDRAGFGWSDATEEEMTARHLATDLAALLRVANVAPPYLFAASSAGGLTVELFAREHPSEVAGLLWLDALSAEIVAQVPEVHGLSHQACTAQTAVSLGVLRLLDPLGLRRLQEPDAGRTMALTYRIQTLAALCSLTRSFGVSATEIARVPALPASIPVVALVHERPDGIVPGATPEALADFKPRWLAAQQGFVSHSVRGERIVAKGSGHLIAHDRPDLVVAALRRLLDNPHARPSAR